MKEFEIWIAFVLPEMGSEGVCDENPRMVGKETAVSFAVACMKHELKSTLASIEKQESTSGCVDSRSLEWWYDPEFFSNAWLGKYYESEEAARVFSGREWSYRESRLSIEQFGRTFGGIKKS